MNASTERGGYNAQATRFGLLSRKLPRRVVRDKRVLLGQPIATADTEFAVGVE